MGFKYTPTMKKRVHNILDLATLGSAFIAGAFGLGATAIGLVALYMFMQVLEFTIEEW